MDSETLNRLLRLCKAVKTVNGHLEMPHHIDGIAVERLLKDASDDLEELLAYGSDFVKED